MSEDSRKALIERSIPFLAEVRKRTASNDLDSWLNTTYGPDSELYQDLARLIKIGVLEEGWAANIEVDGPRYRRSLIAEPTAETHHFSITAVYMDSVERYRGQYHAHPYGELNLVAPIDPGAQLVGPNGWQGAGWTAPAPGSHHYQLTGEGGLLQQLTKRVLESALEGEITDHVGYVKHDATGRNSGNSRNGTRSKTVLTDVGPVEVKVPRDTAGTFEPQIVKKRQRRLTGVDEMVLSLSAKGLTHGEIFAHLAEVYGAEVSKQTITTITDKVMEGMAEWQSRPLDRIYPVVFVDAINVKIRDGQVANRPIYIAMAVTVEGTRDILGIWAGDGGEGAKHWLHVFTEKSESWYVDVRCPYFSLAA